MGTGSKIVVQYSQASHTWCVCRPCTMQSMSFRSGQTLRPSVRVSKSKQLRAMLDRRHCMTYKLHVMFESYMFFAAFMSPSHRRNLPSHQPDKEKLARLRLCCCLILSKPCLKVMFQVMCGFQLALMKDREVWWCIDGLQPKRHTPSAM